MSDSSATGLPPAPRPVTGADPARKTAEDSVLRIVDTTGMLRSQVRAQRIAGEIIAENKDGSIKIATTEGTVTVSRPASRPDLIVGAKLEMDVPAGHPPRHVILRQVETPAHSDTRAADTRTDTRIDTRTTPARSDAPPPETAIVKPPPAPVAIPAQPAEQAPTPRPAPLTPEQIVRLLPVPAGQTEQILRPAPPPALYTLPPVPDAAILPATPLPPAQIIDQLLQIPAELVQNAVKALAQSLTQTSALPAPPQNTPPASGTAPPAVTAQFFFALPPQTATINAPLLQTPAMTAPTANALPPLTSTTLAPQGLTLSPFMQPIKMLPVLAIRPENFILSPRIGALDMLAAANTPPQLQALSKMDAQITGISPKNILTAATTPNTSLTAAPAQNLAQSLYTPPAWPQAASPVIGPEMHAGALQGVVRGMTAQNFPVISVHMPALNAKQDFIIQFPANNLPAGTMIGILPQSADGLIEAAITTQTAASTPATAASAAMVTPHTPMPEFFTAGLWPALDETLQFMQQTAPAAAQSLLQSALPHASSPARLPAMAMMFVAALRGGDMQGWLGDKTADTLRRAGKIELLSRLNRDGGTLSRLSAADPAAPAQEWRSTALPLVWDNHVYKVMLHYRHDHGSHDKDNDTQNGTRFILDIAPPRMGNVQIDGLHRPAAQGAGRLDMILRTRENPSPAMQQSMRALYMNALEQTGLHGELSFQSKKENWVNVKTPV